MKPWVKIQAGEDARKNWRRINEAGMGLEEVAKGLRAAELDLAARSGQGWGMHPWKIYQPARQILGTPDLDGTAWRTVSVRAGTVGGYVVVDADGLWRFPYSEQMDGFADNQIVVPVDTEQYWIWLRCLPGAAPNVMHAVDPAAHELPWESFPYPDEQNLPIGWVDTLSFAAKKKIRIRQILTADVLFKGDGAGAGGVSFGDAYDPLEAYPALTIVWQRTSELIWSTWISLVPVPAGTAPVWPEPVPPDTVYWRCLARSNLQEYSLGVCVDGAESTLNVYGPPGQSWVA